MSRYSIDSLRLVNPKVSRSYAGVSIRWVRPRLSSSSNSLAYIFWDLLVLILALGSALFISFSHHNFVLTVQSGSMEPIIHTGSLILVHPTSRYTAGNIIVFKTAHGLIVHRLQSISSNGQIQTKGDANQNVDPFKIQTSDIIGAPLFVIPYIGYLFATNTHILGFGLLILLPATLIILFEVQVIKGTWRQLHASRYVFGSIIFLLWTGSNFHPSQALLTSSAQLVHNEISTAAIFSSPTPTPSVSPHPTPTPTPTVTPCGEDINITQSNTNTGPDSINENSVEVSQHCQEEHHHSSTATQQTTVNVDTGHNQSQENTLGGGTTTGNISIKISN
jgi:signal peptidase